MGIKLNPFAYVAKWMAKPFRFEVLHKWLVVEGARVLDVGCGNKSPSITKRYYSKCEYHGLDIVRNYNNRPDDIACCNCFWLVDLNNSLDINNLPTDYYDVIIVSHVLEHLRDGANCLKALLTKLKVGGVIYVETPSGISLHLPSMSGTLNFYDDSTHIVFWPLREIEKQLTENGCIIIEARLRRSWKKIFFLPAFLIRAVFFRKPLAGIFWDITGFAQYVLAEKVRENRG